LEAVADIVRNAGRVGAVWTPEHNAPPGSRHLNEVEWVFMKKLLIGVVIGIALGLWWGANIGKGQPFYANPFKSAQDLAKEKANKMLDDAKGLFK
jgi:hypothetical protein